MSSAVTIALLGGPESGKTTYLGALADALQTGGSRSLRLARSAADARGFMRLQEPLQRGEYPQRTKEERHRFQADLTAFSPDGGAPVPLRLEAGDYDGEEVERLFRREASLTGEWRSRAEARGLLLFLRHDATTPLPRDVRPPPSEEERWAAAAGRTAGSAPVAPPAADPIHRFGYGLSADEMSAPPAQPRDRVKVPTTLALIDVLQFLRHVRGLDPGERPPKGSLRVAILLAAWDAVDRAFQDAGPMRYLASELSLLHDFLWSNHPSDDFFCFGLSSTGGDLKNATHREQYLDEHAGFVTWADVAGRVHRTADLTLPVRWALFGDRVLHEDEDG